MGVRDDQIRAVVCMYIFDSSGGAGIFCRRSSGAHIPYAPALVGGWPRQLLETADGGDVVGLCSEDATLAAATCWDDDQTSRDVNSGLESWVSRRFIT